MASRNYWQCRMFHGPALHSLALSIPHQLADAPLDVSHEGLNHVGGVKQAQLGRQEAQGITAAGAGWAGGLWHSSARTRGQPQNPAHSSRVHPMGPHLILKSRGTKPQAVHPVLLSLLKTTGG